MGKGQIISGGSKGQYTVRILYDTMAYDREKAIIQNQLTLLNAQYIAAPESTGKEIITKNIIKLQIISLEKREQMLNAGFTAYKDISAWCADLTEDLTGYIGTAEVPGETTNIQIEPGYNGYATYQANADGQLQLTYNMDAAGLFYNLAMLPGWQKWKPLYRYGKITSISGDLANVDLDDIKSSQQSIEINQTTTLSNVPIEYMTCNGSAFSVDDEVLIKFEGQNWSSPKIIGFKDNPKSCGGNLYVTRGIFCFIWNLDTNTFATGVRDNAGNAVTSIVKIADISTWKSRFDVIGVNPIYTQEVYVKPRSSERIYPLESLDSWSRTSATEEYPYETEAGSTAETLTGYGANGIITGDWEYDFSMKSGYVVGGDLISGNLEIHDIWPFNAENGTYNSYILTSLTNVQKEVGRICSLDRTLKYEEYNGGQECDIGLGTDIEKMYNYTFYSAFPDGTQKSGTFTYTEVSHFSFDEDCTTYLESYAPYLHAFIAGGSVGTKDIPYIVSFYVEYLSSQTITNDECGFDPIWGLTTGWQPDPADHYECGFTPDIGIGLIPCDIGQGDVVQPIQREFFIVKAFSEKSANDPMDLDPFSLPENSGLSGAMKDLYEAQLATDPNNPNNQIPSFSMKFLQ